MEGRTELHQNIKHLLEHINLALCFENSQQLYVEVHETIQNLSNVSTEDMKFILQLSTETMTSVRSRNETRKTRSTLIVERNRFGKILADCQTFKDITDAIQDNKVTSIYEVVELLFGVFYKNSSEPTSEDRKQFLTTLGGLRKEKKLQKMLKQHLKMNILALNCSPLPQRMQLISLLNEILENDKFSSFHENIVIKFDDIKNVSKITGQRLLSKIKHIMKTDKTAPAGTVFNDLYTFKHPSILGCTQPGRCGFIVRFSKLDDNNVIVELSTDTREYTGTGLHLHDIISASDMYTYELYSGNAAPDNKIQVGGGWGMWWWKDWFPDGTDWRLEQGCVVYNISDYLVTKQH